MSSRRKVSRLTSVIFSAALATMAAASGGCCAHVVHLTRQPTVDTHRVVDSVRMHLSAVEGGSKVWTPQDQRSFSAQVGLLHRKEHLALSRQLAGLINSGKIRFDPGPAPSPAPCPCVSNRCAVKDAPPPDPKSVDQGGHQGVQ